MDGHDYVCLYWIIHVEIKSIDSGVGGAQPLLCCENALTVRWTFHSDLSSSFITVSSFIALIEKEQTIKLWQLAGEGGELHNILEAYGNNQMQYVILWDCDDDAEQRLKNQIITCMYTVLHSKSPSGVGW